MKRVAEDVLLGDAHPVWNRGDLRRDVADQHGVFDVETASELVEGLDDGLRRAAGVHLARLVRLRHRERVPLERAGEVGRHELHRRLKRDNLLAHLRRDDRGYPRRRDVLEELHAVSAGGSHDERLRVLDVEVRVGVYRGGEGVVDDDETRMLRLEIVEHRARVAVADGLDLHGDVADGDRILGLAAERDGDEVADVGAARHDSVGDRAAHLAGEIVHHDGHRRRHGGRETRGARGDGARRAERRAGRDRVGASGRERGGSDRRGKGRDGEHVERAANGCARP